MKKTFIAVSLIAFCLLGWFFWNESSSHSDSNNESLATADPNDGSTSAASPSSIGSTVEPISSNRITVVTKSSSSLVKQILDPSARYMERRTAIENLREGISAEDVPLLYKFLHTRTPEDEKQSGHVLKNNLMDSLTYQSAPLHDWAKELVRIFEDHAQHVVIRDYAVQHIVSFYDELERAPVSVAEESRRLLREALFAAVEEKGNSIAGTALLGLSRLEHRYPEFDKQRVAKKALNIAQENGAGELARISSLQVCAQLGVKAVLPDCVNLAIRNDNVPLQISAIAAIGQLGGAEEEPFLLQILSENNQRLRPAAALALSRLQSRIGGNESSTN